MANIDALKQKLEEIVQCTVCHGITYSKILQCPNGHLTCNSCSTRISNCPMCRATLNSNVDERTRALAVEQIIEALKLQEEPKNTGYGMFIQASCIRLLYRNVYNWK